MQIKISRCENCGKLLFKYIIKGNAEIEIKCPRCKVVTKVKITE